MVTDAVPVTCAPGSAQSAENRQSQPWQTRLQTAPASLRVHLIGIGGAGLGPIARVLLEMGVAVSGSDRQAGPATAALAQLGATLYPAQVAENLLNLAADQRPHVVLISSAVAGTNPERAAAAQLGIPVVKRADFLPILLAGRTVIAVAGTHGKTTTTGMIAHILAQTAGQQAKPGYIIGAEIPGLGSAAAGDSPYFVIEADEYDHMFLGLFPTIAVITNVEWDHPDCYPTEASFFQSFRHFLAQVQADGHIISCHDDPGAERLRREMHSATDVEDAEHTEQVKQMPAWATYGTHPQASTRAIGLTAVAEHGFSAQVLSGGEPAGQLALHVPGEHNLRNALAACSVAHLCGVPLAEALAALATYRGSSRRFELKGTVNGITVIDDYGHHPTEVAATLAATRRRYPDRTIHAVFQPHTFSRTKLLLNAMAACFSDADHALITDIYPSREQDDGTIHASHIAAAAQQARQHPDIRYVGDLDAATHHLLATVQPGDIVITFSAGDGNRVGTELLARLTQSNSDSQAVNA